MPLAVALLLHPAGSFVALMATIAAGLFAVQSHRFLPVFTAGAAALLTSLAFLQVPPSPGALLSLCAGVALLHAEFLWPAYGSFGALGLGAAWYGCWWLLAPLAPPGRAAIALAGVLLLLAVVARTMRLRTLPP
jgi:membrane-bound ClpP family serine protease